MPLRLARRAGAEACFPSILATQNIPTGYPSFVLVCNRFNMFQPEACDLPRLWRHHMGSDRFVDI